MTASIIICTRNRAESLRSTLASIGKVAVPPGWMVELLIIDNGSSDQTVVVVNEARLNNVSLRYVSEPIPGQCHARNAGLRAASGEIILFTDDDVRVPSNWVAAMCEPILNGMADAVAGGVAFPPEYEGDLSQSSLSSRRSWLASTAGLDPNQPGRMVGANMSFHRRVLSRVPKFDVELGPGALGFGDETLFSFQLLAAGYKLIGVFDPPVEHHFDLTRLTRGALVELARKMGRSHAFLFHHWEHKSSRLIIPRLALCYLHWCWVQGFDRDSGNSGSKVSDQVLRLEEDLAFYREYLVQRRRQFKYGPRPVVPIENRPACEAF